MSVTKQEAGDKPTINGFAKRVSGNSVSDKLSPQEEKSPLFPFPGKNNKFIQDVSPGKTTWNSLETSMWETPKTRVSYHLHGKTRNCGCKIKWFAPFCLNWEVSEKIYGLCFEAMQFFHLFQLDIPLVADCPPTMSNFMG